MISAEKTESLKSLRNPIKIGKFRLFGDLLPFVGFEDFQINVSELPNHQRDEVMQGVETVEGSFFTAEWLGYGFSWGGFKLPIG